MSRHQFLITVEVEGWPDGLNDGRTEADYAWAALGELTELPDAMDVDGFADLDGPTARLSAGQRRPTLEELLDRVRNV